MNDGINYPRVLVISHNAFSLTSNNGKTFSSIFAGWQKEKIAQLYFHNEVPDFSVCNNFFYMTDENMVFERKEKIGEKVFFNNKGRKEQTNSKIYNRTRKKRLQIFLFVRNFIWTPRKWDNKNLHDWIDEFSPEVIFFVGGGCYFFI